MQQGVHINPQFISLNYAIDVYMYKDLNF